MPSTQELLGPAGSPAAMWRRAKDVVADLPPALQVVVAEAWPDLTVVLRSGMIPPIPAWPAGPVTVVGDAINVAPGFGGNLAMQDAHHLCEALAEAYHGRLDLVDAIDAYEDTMRRNSFFAPVAANTGA
ncbi:FAD-dependent oxidoreductase [Nocardia ignorata]|nr:FAD-dependent monooxygenase [Nocardia ignorata]